MIFSHRTDGASRTVAFVALGSNLSEREKYLRAAVEGFVEHGNIEVEAVSSVYESPAHTLPDAEDQPPFLNAVVKLRTVLSPQDLLGVCLEIEKNAGRDRGDGRRWAPRTLDVDILLYGDQTISSDALSIPHPRMGDRRFVLRPLADLAPDYVVPPPWGATVGELLERCADRDIPKRTAISLRGQGPK